jgi:succinate-acetate transporter protein
MALAWSAITFVAVYFVQAWHDDMDAVYQLGYQENVEASISISVSYSGLIIVLYGVIVFAPSSILYQRPALRLYSLFWLTYELVTIFDVIVTAIGLNWPFCVESANRLLMFGIVQPFIIMKTLKDDCLYWQGL